MNKRKRMRKSSVKKLAQLSVKAASFLMAIATAIKSRQKKNVFAFYENDDVSLCDHVSMFKEK